MTIDDVMVVRSTMEPGWSWLEHLKPTVEDLENCPLHHHEYVVSGRIRYEMAGGGSVEAGPGTYLEIEPGHLADRGWTGGRQALNGGALRSQLG